MNLRHPSLWLAPLIVLGVLGFTIGRAPLVEPGLQVAKTGVVLDAQTQRPLAGAYVVVRWLEQLRSPVSGAVAGQCLNRVIVRTDDNGRYAIPATAVVLAANRTFAEREYFWDAYAYTPGYAPMTRLQHPRALASTLPAVQDLQSMLLVPAQAQPEQRVSELADTLKRFSCEPFAKELGPIAEQIYAEAYTAACLPEPNSAADSLARLHGDGRGTKPCESFRQVSKNP